MRNVNLPRGIAKPGRRPIAICGVMLFMLLTMVASATPSEGTPRETTTPNMWDSATLDLLAKMPVQDGGRVKPLDTYARFKLLAMNGARKCKTPDGRSLSSMEWLLDCFFHPDAVSRYQMFRIETSEVVEAIGLPPHPKKRDRYSYAELAPGRTKLFDLARSYMAKQAQQRTSLETQIINLGQNMLDFESLTDFLNFAQYRLSTEEDNRLGPAFAGGREYALSDVLKQAQEVVAGANSPDANHANAFNKVIGDLHAFQRESNTLAVFPPADPSDKAWLTPGDMIDNALHRRTLTEDALAFMRGWEYLVQTRDDPSAFRNSLATLCANIEGVAQARGEYKRVPLEVFFYKGRFFYYSQILFMMSFVLVALSWLLPRNRVIRAIPAVPLLLATVLLVAGIVLRCIIRGRPPVSTLYETVLFTTAVVVIVALVIERTNRQRIALSAGTVLGMIGIFVANRYEMRDAADTMPTMIAVLDTNFWLATHVTTILVGYAGGLLAAAIAHVYLIGKLFEIKKGDSAFYGSIGRTVYGVLCFAFFFSVIGTVLGGIWANESWGRFWGWDPKENGALMIVLWMLAILHARSGGYIRDYGVCVATVAAGMIIAFSWWGVNLLGVGLHSYGFTSGILNSLLAFWVIEGIVLTVCVIAWFTRESRKPSRAAANNGK